MRAARVVWRIARLLGALSLLATAFATLARSWWVFELFTHFRIQILAAQIVILLAMLALRRPAWVAALSIAVVFNAASVIEYAFPERPERRDRPSQIRVIAANVLASNRDAAGLIDLVRTRQPDVVAVLELTESFAAALRPLEEVWSHRLLAPDAGTFGIGVYSRLPLVRSSAFELEGFAAIHAEVAEGAGSWHFVAVHLLPPMSSDMADARNRQLTALTDYLRTLDGPVAVAGDFNLTPYSPYFADFTDHTGLSSSLRGFGLGYTWPESMPVLGIPIDHVLVSDEFEIVNYARGEDIGSDHFPIIVDMNLQTIGLD